MNIIRLKRKVPENLYDEVLRDQNFYRKVSGKLVASHSSRGSTSRDKNRLTTTMSYSRKRTLKWVQGNNSSQKYNNVPEKKLLPLTDEAFLHDGYTFMQDNGLVHKSTFTKSCQDTMDIYTTI